MKEIKCFADLIGLEITSIDGGKAEDDEVIIYFKDGEKVMLYHAQDCCESVRINDIDGDIQDLVGGTVVEFEEVSNYEGDQPEDSYDESHTWTFYKIGTTKGFVSMRWLGQSNGYYSEQVTASVLSGGKWIDIN